jgi:hypothetical protein
MNSSHRRQTYSVTVHPLEPFPDPLVEYPLKPIEKHASNQT